MPLLDALLLEPAPFEVWIAYRLDGLKGSGTASDPWNGSTQALFDARMSELPANTRVHLGPSPKDGSDNLMPFLTKGYAEGVSGGWQIKAGQKILGAGIDVTLLQLDSPSASAHYFAIGHAVSGTAKVDFAEVQDLTIDCSLPTTGSTTECGAVRLRGDHATIRRVKAVNWGSRSSTTPCFVFSVITAMPGQTIPALANPGVQECVAIDPSAANVGPVYVLHAGGIDGQSFTSGEAHGRSPYIRNCFVDCGVTTPNPTSGLYRAISMSWCRGGVVEGNQIYNADIGGPYQDSRSIRDLIVRNNFYKNVGVGVRLKLGALLPGGGWEALSIDADNSHTANVMLDSVSHYLAVGDRVRVDPSGLPAVFGGIFIVSAVTGGDSFTYQLPSPATGSGGGTVYRVLSVGRAIIEGNVIELPLGVSDIVAVSITDENDGTPPYAETPDYAHGDIFIRNNKVRAVDATAPLGSSAVLIQVNGAKNLQVSHNILETDNATALKNKRCGNVTYFNNRTPGGVLIRGLNNDTSNKYDELATEAEDAFLLAALQR